MLYKPARVTITVSPSEPESGRKAVLKCQSGPSNPTASVVWRYNGRRMQGKKEEEEKAIEVGKKTYVELDFPLDVVVSKVKKGEFIAFDDN